MKKNFTLNFGLIAGLLATMILQPVMSQKKIAFITNAANVTTPSVSYTYYRDSATIVTLKENGYVVDTIRDNNIDDIVNNPTSVDMYNRINAADLVIISRSVTSSNYDGASKTNWANVVKPVIIQSPYPSRKAQLGLFNNINTTMPTRDTNTIAKFWVKNDYILKGVTLAADSSVLFYIDRINFFNVGADSLNRTSNWKLIASADTGIATKKNLILIARLDSGKESYTGSGFIPKAPWTYMTVGAAEQKKANQVLSKNNFQLTDAGKQILFNEIAYLLGDTSSLAAPVASSATSITKTGFTANWNASAGATGYRLDVATDAAFTSLVAGFNSLDVANVTTYAVTGLSPGTTYYYRVKVYNASTTTSNSNVITATTESNALVTQITVGGGNAITAKGGTLQMTATVAPDNAADKTVTWSVDKTSVATISATGLLTAASNGSVVVTATAKDASGIKGTATVTISGQSGTGLANGKIKPFTVFPNPASDVLKILNTASLKKIEIVNVHGQILKTFEISGDKFEADIHDLQPGLYFVRGDNGSVEKIQKN